MRFMEKHKEYRALPILCFGDINWTGLYQGERGLKFEPICYVPATQTDMVGNARTIAVRTSTAQAALDVSVPDIFEEDI